MNSNSKREKVMLSKYKLTHLFVNFNTTGKSAAKFRKALCKLGFMRFDLNTFFRPTAPDKVDEITAAIEAATMRPMTVKIIRITDKQWTDAKVMIGKEK